MLNYLDGVKNGVRAVCRTLERLMRRVYYYLHRRLRQLRRQCQEIAA